MIIDGHKKKAKEPKPPYIAADSARSKSYAKILMALGEGEVEGSANGLLDGRDILLDGVSIINPDGSRNFDVKYEFRKGSLDQDYIQAMPMVESDTNVGFALKQSTPFVRSINNAQVDQIRFRFSWPQLVDNKSNGDRVGTSVTYAIDVAEGAGSFVEYQRHTLSEKSTSKYERSHTVDLPRSPDGWRVRVRRLTADSTSDMLQNAMFVEAYTEIIDAKLTYPNTALLYLEFDAEQFPQIPKVSVRMKGRVVRVPENYNPTTRQYNGIWDGRFKWAYTNNPAWCCLDLLLSERFGLGVRIGLEQVDKWALYDIARWCDVMVSDGAGGMQPRHTLNVYINTAQDAWRILGDLASVFNGVSYWNGEQLEVQADTLRDAEYEFTMANIVDGVIEYSSIARKDKYSQIAVKYDDPDNEFQTDTVAVNDLSMTRRFGVVQSQMAAFGCTNRAEAQRKGKWALISNKYDRSATWKTGLDGYVPKVGSVVRIADNALAGAAIGGRVKLTVGGAIQLDRAPRAQVGDKLNINMPGGKSQQRTLTVVDGDTVRVDTPYTDAVQAGSQWSVDAADLVGQLFKITSIRQDSKTQFTIQGVEYNHGKFDYVDNGANIEDRPISITPVGEQAPPTNPVVSSFSYVEQGLAITNARFDWVGAVGALYYDVEWRKDNMQWVSTARTSTTGMDIEGVYTGAYEFRVRAVNAGGITSTYAHSLPVVITGKIGAPPALAYLRTVSKVMGIELQWGFPAQGAEDAALVEIHYSLALDDQIAELLGEYSYPTDNHTLMGLAHATELYFKGRIIDRTGNIGPWSDWAYGTSSSDSDEILSYLDGQIGGTQLDDFLKGEISKIDGFEGLLDDLEQDVQAQLAAMQAKLDQLGSLEMYDPAESYLEGSMVKFDNIVYLAKQDVPAGTTPPNPTYWENIGSFESVNDIVAALAVRVQVLESSVTDIDGALVAETARTDIMQSKIDDPVKGLDAQSSAVQDLTTRVENTETGLASGSAAITNLTSSVTTATNNAAAAQQAAQNAATLAGNKGEVIFSGTAPTEDKRLPQNLWIDTKSGANTPKRWSGSAWLPVTDKAATDALAAANAAAAAVATKADASALQSLTTRVENTETGLASDSAAITNLTSSVTTATNNAAAAQQAAQDAATLAGNKGEVIYSASAPVAAKRLAQNLWIDTTGNKNTPKRWDGSNWVVVTDKVATDAASAAADALAQVSTKAESSAVQALTTRVEDTEAGVTANSEMTTALSASLRGSRADGEKADALEGWYAQAAYSESVTVQTTETEALAERSEKLEVSIGKNSAAVETVSRVQADTNGKLSSMWGVRMRQGADGKWVNAGIGLGIENVDGVYQSQFIVDANLFAVRNGVNGNQEAVFAVQGGQNILRSALIGDATITMLKIGGDLYSTNYVAGVSGWKLSRNGGLEFNATYAGQGRVRLNSDGLYVYDAVNSFPRVKIGRL